MNTANQQIVAAYESMPDGVSFEDFCAAFPSYDADAIKIVLASGSSKYQATLKQSDTTFVNEVFQAALECMAYQVKYAEKDRDRQNAAKFIINENKGRHDIKNLRHMNINVINIDDRMKKAKEALNKSKSQPVIDIPSELQAA